MEIHGRTYLVGEDKVGRVECNVQKRPCRTGTAPHFGRITLGHEGEMVVDAFITLSTPIGGTCGGAGCDGYSRFRAVQGSELEGRPRLGACMR